MQFSRTKWVKEYFTFSQKERRAVILLAILAVLFALLPALFPFLVKDDIELVADTVTQNQLAQLNIIPERKDARNNDGPDGELYEPKYNRVNSYAKDEPMGELFNFDPNMASEAEWRRLGIREKTIKTIFNYRNKGGKFYKPEDLQRIYGFRKQDVERLLPFVNIEPAEKSFQQPASFTVENKSESKKSTVFLLDINSADTTEWKRLVGIGSKLSQRIVNFRSKLGGFASIEQVGETFGLPDSTFQKIKQQLQVNPSSVKRINVNTATIDELKAHPYIKYPLANAIVQYRNEHGSFKSVEDLQKLGAIDGQLFKKITPYLVAE